MLAHQLERSHPVGQLELLHQACNVLLVALAAVEQLDRLKAGDAGRALVVEICNVPGRPVWVEELPRM
jgi:hypothetical protein